MASIGHKNAYELLAQLKEVIQEQERTIHHQNDRIKQLEDENASLKAECEKLRCVKEQIHNDERSGPVESANNNDEILTNVVKRSSSLHRKHLEEQDAKGRPESYELSSDLFEKRIEVLRNKYGGAENAEKAARIIQEAYRRYRMRINFRKIRKSKNRRLTVENKVNLLEDKLEISSSIEVVELVKDSADDSEEETFDKLNAVDREQHTSTEGDVQDDEEETFNSLYEKEDSPKKEIIEKEPETPTKDISKVLTDINTDGIVVNFSSVKRRRHRHGYETVVIPAGNVPDRQTTDSPSTNNYTDSGNSPVIVDTQRRKPNGNMVTSKRAVSMDVSDFSPLPDPNISSLSHAWTRSSSNISLTSNDVEVEDDSLRSSDTASITSGQSEFSNSITLEGYQRRSTLSTRGSWHIDSKNDVMRKRLYRIGLNLFNKKPEKGIEFLVEHAFIEKTAPAVASFLLNRKGLSRQMVGEYLGNSQIRFNSETLDAVCELMDFSGMELDEALRDFQRQVKVQGEAQKVDKLVEAFSQRYCTCNPKFAGSLNNPDAIFILAFAIIMLNTDLHSPNMKHEKRMTESDFVKNLRGVDGGDDLNVGMLRDIYNRIKSEELKTGEDHVTQVLNVEKNIIGKKPVLAVPHRRLVCYCRLYQVTDPAKPQKIGLHQRAVFLFNDLLLVTKVVQKKKNSSTYSYKLSLPLQGMNVLLFETTFYLFGIRLINTLDNKVLITFNAPNEHDRNKFVTDLKESINEVQQMETYRIGAELERAQLPMEGRMSLTRDAKYLSASMHNLNEMRGSREGNADQEDDPSYQAYISKLGIANKNNNNLKNNHKSDKTNVPAIRVNDVPSISVKGYEVVSRGHHGSSQNRISLGFSHV